MGHTMIDFAWIFTASGWLALATLTGMEIVLGIDNVIFVSLIGSKLPPNAGAVRAAVRAVVSPSSSGSRASRP